ncbi:alanine racemase [Nocardioides sp. SYSU D00038]|uniref:alanine racemase n=1 Tax=Nocardioides sp. SYSU D00038 TaxID=2812554 RepID=UPI0019684E75|nr:alanine racemase [Nocardioides sp. SYSU D00038]
MSPLTTARAELVVDLAAIRHNVRVLRELVRADGPVQLMAVVKADAYGHGLLEAARAAREGGADWLGVATLDEAQQLREAGDDGPVLCWLTVPGEDYDEAVAADIDVTAYTVAELDEIAAAARQVQHPARVQLKVDTGLSRGGATAGEWEAVVARALEGQRAGHWEVTGIWSHLASSDEPDDPMNDAQEELFGEFVAVAEEAGLRPGLRHLANSAGAILRPSARFDLVRCGIATYGLDPAPGHTPDLGLRPAMTARATLALVKDLEAGASVSYGHTWTARHATTVGLVPVGYADGVPRVAGNSAEVWAAGARRPVRGRICMDQFMVDLEGDHPAAGDDVVLFGTAPAPTAQDWAEACGTISYEIVTRLGGRMTRRHVDTDTERAW